MLQILLIVVGGMVGILLVAGLIMKKQYKITSEIIIDKPQSEVFDFVKMIRNQEKYSKWVMADPNVKMNYKGNDGTVGFVASWNSEMRDVGVGEQEIIKIKEGERYDVEIRFQKPFKATNYAYTITEAVSPTRTKVTTTFDAKAPFPTNIMVPFVKKMLLRDMNQNASNLKKVLEAN